MNNNTTYWLNVLDNWAHHTRHKEKMNTNDIANLLAIASELSKEIAREQSIAEYKRER
jgi:hypothetical protein